MAATLGEYQHAKEQGRSQEDLLHLMHQQGLTITEAIKAFMKIYDIPLGQAKERVSACPLWRDVVEAAQPLHDQLEGLIRDPQN